MGHTECLSFREGEPEMSKPNDSLHQVSLHCAECPHVFTPEELAAEDKNAWGHPCHGVSTKPITVCESYREPLRQDAEKAAYSIRFDGALNLTAQEKGEAISRLSRYGDFQGHLEGEMYWTPAPRERDTAMERLAREGFVVAESRPTPQVCATCGHGPMYRSLGTCMALNEEGVACGHVCQVSGESAPDAHHKYDSAETRRAWEAWLAQRDAHTPYDAFLAGIEYEKGSR